MPDNRFFNQPQPSNQQQPINQPLRPYDGAGNLPNYQPYPPPHQDELRLTRILERIEHKLDMIFAKLVANEK